MRAKIDKLINKQDPQIDIKLVSNNKKKLSIKNMGCKKCEFIDWRF